MKKQLLLAICAVSSMGLYAKSGSYQIIIDNDASGVEGTDMQVSLVRFKQPTPRYVRQQADISFALPAGKAKKVMVTGKAIESIIVRGVSGAGIGKSMVFNIPKKQIGAPVKFEITVDKQTGKLAVKENK